MWIRPLYTRIRQQVHQAQAKAAEEEEAQQPQGEEPTLLDILDDEEDCIDGTEDDVPHNDHLHSDMDTDIDDF